jgi:hypothetical protein
LEAAVVVRAQMLERAVAVVAAQVDSVLHRAFRYRLGLDIRSQSAAAVLADVLPMTALKVRIPFFPQ